MLLVKQVAGPAQCRAGGEATYRVVAYNLANPDQVERARISWMIECDGAEIAMFPRAGDTLRYAVPAELVGRTIRVMAYLKNPSPAVCVTTDITGAAAATGDAGGQRQVEVFREGRRVYAEVDGEERFYVGSIVRYGSGCGLMNTSDNAGPVYRAEDYRERFGFWADFIAPMTRCESEGYFDRINTYDRARFTFGFMQHAAHTANNNFVLLLRHLLALPAARGYFPDLALDVTGRLCRVLAGRPTPLEVGDPPLPLLDYLNPSLEDVEDVEAVNAAKFIHWARNDPAHRVVQVAFAIEDIRKKMRGYAQRYDLKEATDAMCLAIADIRHQGRARSADIEAALRSADALESLLCLGETAYPERIETLRSSIDELLQNRVLGNRRYDSAADDFLTA